MSEAETCSSGLDGIRMRLSDLEDFCKSFLKSQLEKEREEREALAEDVRQLQQEVAELREWKENMIGLADDQRSTPEKRTMDLREAMIRAAVSKDTAGVTWWREQVEEHLATLGHAGFSKPVYYSTMEDVAEADGFDETTKTVTIQQGNREITKDVDAVRVKLDELPHDPRKSGSNRATTRGVQGGATDEKNPRDEDVN